MKTIVWSVIVTLFYVTILSVARAATPPSLPGAPRITPPISIIANGAVTFRDFNGTCGAADSTAALQAAADYLTNNVVGGTIQISCPITINGGVTLGNSTRLTGVGPIYYFGMLNTSSWPPTVGPAINCASTITPCITVSGTGVSIDHLNLGNPQPAPPGSGTYVPTNYPYVITTTPTKNWAGLELEHLTFTSASQCIDLEGSPNYNTVGIAGSQFTLKDLWMNPCLNEGIMLHHIDNTGEIANVEYDFWWNRNNPTLDAYVRTHSIGMTFQYAANTRLNGIEFFSNKIAIDQVNDTVQGGFNMTFAAANIQGDNISFNEVCQAMANENGTSLISSGTFTNVILYQDTTDPAVNCPLNSSAAIDLSASFGANWRMSNVKVGNVQTVAAIGPSSTLHLSNVDILGYSYFAAGGPAFKVSAAADFNLGTTLMAALRPASGTCGYGACGTAGNIIGQGLDGTQGYQALVCVGGGTKPAEGSACLQGSLGLSQSGAATFYDLSGTLQGFIGSATSTGLNINAPIGSLFLTSHNGTHTATAVFGTDVTNHNLINVNPLPTTAPTGTGNAYVCVDNGGNLYIKSPCPGALGPHTTCPNILDYGAVADGVTFNDAAWTAALAGTIPGKPCIYFPAGDYQFNAQVSVNLASGYVFSIFGDSPDNTLLRWPGGGGILINGQASTTAFHVRDLTLTTNAVNVGVAIDAEWGAQHNSNRASSTIDRVRIQGTPIGTNYWATGIKLNGISDVNISNANVFGQTITTPTASVGLDIEAPDANPCFIFKIIQSNFIGALNGFRYGSSIQGVYFANSQFISNANAIYVTPATGTIPQAQLSIINSEFDSNTGPDVILVDTGSTLSSMMVMNSLFYLKPGTQGIHTKPNSGTGHTLVGNQFFGSVADRTPNGMVFENTGINIISDTTCSLITNCVTLTSSASGWAVRNIKTDGVTGSAAVVNGGAAQSYIIGFLDNSHRFFPEVLTITGASSASGLIQLTLSPGSTDLVVGQIVLVAAPGLANQPASYRIASIPDGTHVVLDGSAFAGSLTSNGFLSVQP